LAEITPYQKAIKSLAIIMATKPSATKFTITDRLMQLELTFEGKNVTPSEIYDIAKWVNESCRFAPEGSEIIGRLNAIRPHVFMVAAGMQDGGRLRLVRSDSDLGRRILSERRQVNALPSPEVVEAAETALSKFGLTIEDFEATG